jgi:peroxiredoxin
MALTESTMLPLGTKAPAYDLPDTISGKNVSLDSLTTGAGTVIMFICNHCPFVTHVQSELVRLARDYQPKGIQFVAISANDVANYPEDSPENMARFARKNGFTFPYLYDETQEVAKAYGAACTPDFYIFNQGDECVYRGRLDDSRPGNNIPVTGKDLRGALDALLAGNQIFQDQKPSIGCNIKWK